MSDNDETSRLLSGDSKPKSEASEQKSAAADIGLTATGSGKPSEGKETKAEPAARADQSGEKSGAAVDLPSLKIGFQRKNERASKWSRRAGILGVILIAVGLLILLRGYFTVTWDKAGLVATLLGCILVAAPSIILQ